MRPRELIGCLFVACAAQTAVAQGCNIAVTPVAFGTYDPYQTVSLGATGTIEVTCAKATPYTIRLGSGQNTSDSSLRRMRHAGGMGTLTYMLYRNASGTEIWADGTHSTFTQSGIAATTAVRLVVYGRLPGRQNVRAGSYADMVTVTAEW